MSDFYTLGLGFDTTPAQKGAADLARVVTASAGAIAEQAKALKSSEAQLASYANAQVRAAQSSQVRSFGGDPYKNAVAAASAIRDQADAERVRTASMAERIKVFEQTQYRVKLLTTEIDKQTASAERLSGAGSSGGGNAGMLGVAKSFGLATKQIKEFAHFGATVFAGDILAKTLGFSSVLGLVTAASDSVAKALIEIGTAFRDNYYPELKKAQEELEAQTEATNDLAAAHRALAKELAGPELMIGGRRIKTAGIQGQDLYKLQSSVIAGQSKISSIDQILGSGSYEATSRGEELRQQRDTLIKQVVELAEKLQYQAVVQENLNYLEQQAIDLGKERTEEFRKSAAAAKAGGYDLKGGSGGKGYLHELGVGPESFDPAKAESLFGSASARSRQVEPLVRNAFEKLGRGIVAALAAGFGSGNVKVTDDDPTGNRARNDAYIKNAAVLRGQQAETLQQMKERAGEAREIFSYDVGGRIAFGFEEAILSGNRLRDVLKGILQDLERMVFRQLVTQPFGQFLGGLVNGIGGNGVPVNSGSGPFLPPGYSSPNNITNGGGGGGTNITMIVNTPDANSFRQSGRQIAEDMSNRMRR